MIPAGLFECAAATVPDRFITAGQGGPRCQGKMTAGAGTRSQLENVHINAAAQVQRPAVDVQRAGAGGVDDIAGNTQVPTP